MYSAFLDLLHFGVDVKIEEGRCTASYFWALNLLAQSILNVDYLSSSWLDYDSLGGSV